MYKGVSNGNVKSTTFSQLKLQLKSFENFIICMHLLFTDNLHAQTIEQNKEVSNE